MFHSLYEHCLPKFIKQRKIQQQKYIKQNTYTFLMRLLHIRIWQSNPHVINYRLTSLKNFPDLVHTCWYALYYYEVKC